MRVWIAQCLCGPNRHAILGGAGEAETEAEAREMLLPALREGIRLLRSAWLNPWCGICGAVEAAWQYEVAPTPFSTLEDAGPELARLGDENLSTALVHGNHGSKPPTRH